MDLESFRALLGPAGQQAIQLAAASRPSEQTFLSHFQTLTRQLPAPLARAALETAILRQEAASKFPFADRLYLTREAYEQSSAYPVAMHRAARFSGLDHLFDLGCSIGGDSFGLAPLAPLTAVDLDPLRLEMARANLQALGLAERASFIQADLRHKLPFERTAGRQTGIFFDPARRQAGRRVFSVQDYQPPLSIVQGWLSQSPALGVKLSPGVNLAELEPYPAEIEFISLHGELKEAVLWFGPLKTATGRATLLPGGETLVGPPAPRLPISKPLAFLYEPDPAVLRAGLVANLGHILGASQLDPDIAYLTSASQTATPFARCWPVSDWFPFQLKRLRAYLRERNIGQVVIKKRGSPLIPEELERQLRLSGSAQATIFLTQWMGDPIILIAGAEIKITD